MHTIIPKPNGPIIAENKKYFIPKYILTDTGAFAPWCLKAFSSRTNKEIMVGPSWLKLIKSASCKTEGYTLEVSENGVVITAATENGVVLALTSLYLMMDGDGAVPYCQITDSPKYSYRGLLIDCSRHFFPVDVVKKVIEQMALVKLNVLHWHLTDDQGWRIESKKFPRLHEISDEYYSHDEICQVVEYARDRGVEVIPEIDLPGHTTAVLAAFPELSCSGQKMEPGRGYGIFQNALCAGKESVFVFLEELFDEVCPLFPSKRFHVGGDEVHKDAWNKCPYCAKRMADEGITNCEDLQGYFTSRVAAMLAKHGKRILCWNDSLESKNLPKDVLIQYWTNAHKKSMQEYMAKGGDFVYSWKFTLYFDYPYDITPVSKVYGFKPVIEDDISAETDGLIGFEGCLWAEGVADLAKLGEMMFPRAYALAENAWTWEKDYADFRVRLKNILSISLENGVPYGLEENGDSSGKER